MSEFSTAILALNPAMYLRLGETSGTDAADEATANNTCTYSATGITLNKTGSLRWMTTPDLDPAAEFNGAAGCIDCGSAAAIDQISENITLLASVYLNAWPSGLHYIVTSGVAASKQGYYLRIYYTGGNIKLQCGSWSNPTSYGTEWTWPVTGYQAIQLCRWYRIAAVYDGTYWKLYVNGAEVGSTAGAHGAIANDAKIGVGALYTGSTPGSFFNGRLDEIAIIASALTPAQVLADATLANLNGWTTPMQRQFLANGLGATCHFNIATWLDQEWGNGDESADTFAPTGAAFMTDWINRFKLTRARQAVLTVKHIDGFPLWPSTVAARDVSDSAWYAANGSPDLVGLWTDGVRAADMEVGLYFCVTDRAYILLHPRVDIDGVTITATCNDKVITFTGGYSPTSADVNATVYLATGTGLTPGWYTIASQVAGTSWTLSTSTGMSGGAVTGKADVDSNSNFTTYIQAQLTELLDGTYGDIDFIFMDAWSWGDGGYRLDFPTTVKLIRNLQPDIIVLNNARDHNPRYSDVIVYELSDLMGATIPAEGNVIPAMCWDTIGRGNWFWKSSGLSYWTAAQVEAERVLLNARTCTYWMNFLPDTTGVIPSAQRAILEDMQYAVPTSYYWDGTANAFESPHWNDANGVNLGLYPSGDLSTADVYLAGAAAPTSGPSATLTVRKFDTAGLAAALAASRTSNIVIASGGELRIGAPGVDHDWDGDASAAETIKVKGDGVSTGTIKMSAVKSRRMTVMM